MPCSCRYAMTHQKYQFHVSKNVAELQRNITNDVNGFYTGNEIERLLGTGQFNEVKFVSLDELYTGDILVDAKGTAHTVIVTEGLNREWAWITIPFVSNCGLLKVGSTVECTDKKKETEKSISAFSVSFHLCNAHLVF